MTIIVAQELLL